MEKIFIIKNTI